MLADCNLACLLQKWEMRGWRMETMTSGVSLFERGMSKLIAKLRFDLAKTKMFKFKVLWMIR